MRFSYIQKLKASTGISSVSPNEPKTLENNTEILNVLYRGWVVGNRKITRFFCKQKLYINNFFMKGEQSGAKSSSENRVKEMRKQILLEENLFQSFEYMTSSQIFSRMLALNKVGRLKPPGPVQVSINI